MAERRVEVVAVDARRVELRGLGSCTGCGGCGGRCALFGAEAPDGRMELAAELFPYPPRPGERWVLTLPDRELLRQSWRGYGLGLAGLLVGAATGHQLALHAGFAIDLATAIGALAGTLLASRLSKRTPAADPCPIPDPPPA